MAPINNKNPLFRLTLTAVMAALISVFTAYIGHIPLPGSGGYIHFGDALVFLAACILPAPYAVAAATLGAGLADLLTYPAYILPTVLIKSLVVLCFSSRGEKILSKRNVLALLPALLITAGGYFAAQLLLFPGEATWRGILVESLIASLIQWAGSAAGFAALGLALQKINFGRFGKR